MIFKAISKTGSLGSCFACMDIGSSEWLAMQNLQRFPIQLKPELYQSGSFRPASQTKIGLPPAVQMLYWLLLSPQNYKKATD
jgi:hypothetical protein